MSLTSTYNGFYEITQKMMSSHFHICCSYEHMPDDAVCAFLQSKLNQKSITLYSTNRLGYKSTTNECLLQIKWISATLNMETEL